MGSFGEHIGNTSCLIALVYVLLENQQTVSNSMLLGTTGGRHVGRGRLHSLTPRRNVTNENDKDLV